MSTLSEGPGTIDPRSLERRPRRAAYALPTLFTAGNIFLGFIAILRAFQGAMHGAVGPLGPSEDLAVAAKAIAPATAPRRAALPLRSAPALTL